MGNGPGLQQVTVRKSNYKQASISLICSSLVPQSQAITATSKPPEMHLKGIKSNAMHCHTHATCTPMPLHHARVCHLVMTPATISEHQKDIKVVGSIQYIACVTRPDRACAAHSLARHMSASICYNSESTRAQRPAGSVCAHAGDGRPYLAQGSSMQYNRRKQTQCACETVVRRKRE